MPALSERLRFLVRRREPSLPVGLVRLGVGLGTFLKLLDVAPKLWTTTQPKILRLPYSDALPQPTPGWVLAITVLWAISALLFTAGWGGRKVGVVLTAVLVAVLLLDRQIYSNHLYLAALLVPLLTLADSTRALSLDARHGQGAPEVAGWPLTLLRCQLSILYFFAAVSKINPVFLAGGVLAEQIPWLAGSGALLPVASVGAIGVELFLAFGLWFARTRKLAALVGVVFHVVLVATMGPKVELLVFALLSVSLYVLFFPPATIARRLPGWREPAA